MKVFLAAARHLNYTRAGRELRLQQPTVSAHIKQLEAELGVQLFEHVGRRLVLTEAGRILETVARKALFALEDVQSALDEYKGLERGTLRLGASTTPGLYLLPRLLARFNRLYPNIALRSVIENTVKVERMVLQGEVDFGFVGGHLVTGEIVSRPWIDDHIVLITPPDHRFARASQADVRMFADETFIQREAGSATQAMIETEMEKAGVAFKRVVELGHPEAIKEAVISGMGVAFVSRFAVEREAGAGDLAVVPLAGFEIQRQLRICYRPGRRLSKADAALMSEVERTA
ncbi:MAG: LysR substrate-binding domain-containing protein [Blastocatellia bacterium]|nr:LysR substrate-binding domain-containing protein [Blastocatellia bacterium]